MATLRSIYEACTHQRLNTQQETIERASDPTEFLSEDRPNSMAIHLAIEYGHLGVEQYLVERGFDINVLNEDSSLGRDRRGVKRF